MSSVLVNFGFFVLGWGAKVLYDWKIYPAITKSHKRAEQSEREVDEARAHERQRKLDGLNERWKQNREALRLTEQPLKSFNQLNRFPDEHRPPKCLELAAAIEEAARRLEGIEYKNIKAKLLEYAGRRNQISSNTGLKELMGVFQRTAGDINEPLALWHEAELILEQTAVPPFSEKDI